MDDQNQNDTWSDLQALRSRQNSLREKLQRRKKEREDIVQSIASGTSGSGALNSYSSNSNNSNYSHNNQTSLQHLHSKTSDLASQSSIISHATEPNRFASTPNASTSPASSLAIISQINTTVNSNLNGQPLKHVPSASSLITQQHANSALHLSNRHAADHQPKISSRSNQRQVERHLLQCLCDAALKLPVDSRILHTAIRKSLHQLGGLPLEHQSVISLLEKFAHQQLISVIKDTFTADGETCLVVSSIIDHGKLIQFLSDAESEAASQRLQQQQGSEQSINAVSATATSTGASDDFRDQKRTNDDVVESQKPNKQAKLHQSVANEDELMLAMDVNLESLLSLESTREKENKRMGEELLELLSKPTAKERSLVERFRSVGGGQAVQEFCTYGTKEECIRNSSDGSPCGRLHFQKIIQRHTDESLGDCSFLNTCFHMDSCKYVHYRVDYSTRKPKEQSSVVQTTDGTPASLSNRKEVLTTQRFKSILYPPQWIQCDLRFFDMTILGKFSVVMADPPWDIHMELPYGTLSDDEMRKLNIPSLQDEGLIFLWVTGRAMELGRECLKLWGYERCDEIIWVKTNQLQRIIRTGRTGHWLNHGKEHCLVGIKGQPKDINRGLDCDVIVAEVRATSHKPDEIYGIIERLSPGTKKIELFGRPHNVQPNWITLGNQLDGVRLVDPLMIEAFKNRYRDGNCMEKPS